MSGKRHIIVTFGAVLSVSLVVSAVSVMLASYHYRLLWYHASDFTDLDVGRSVLFAAIGFLAGSLLFFFTFWYRNRKEALRIRALEEYLEQVNTGKAVILSASGEDDFSRLEDEIYKTVTFLYQTKDSAIRARNDYAENLSNIAHQIKTPITAILLSVRMMKDRGDSEHLEQVEKQLLRLAHLEEALLVLSRIDAGTLVLQKNEVDVFTLLMLAADNLQELLVSSGVSVDVPEMGEMMISADLDWTMEAVMNLMKNCMEHSHGGMIHCTYAQNPLYTEILIWDEGKGFAKSTLLHIIGSVDRPTEGRVIVNGTELSGLNQTQAAIFRRRKVGLVYQFYNLIPTLTVRKNILMPLALDRKKPNEDYFEQIVKDLGIADRLEALPNQLSGGQQQRVAIARSLIYRPALLLADEPTGGVKLVVQQSQKNNADVFLMVNTDFLDD